MAAQSELTLTKEQAALLLPLLQKQMDQPSSKSKTSAAGCRFSNEELFQKKKKNHTASEAQNYLLVRVSFYCKL